MGERPPLPPGVVSELGAAAARVADALELLRHGQPERAERALVAAMPALGALESWLRVPRAEAPAPPAPAPRPPAPEVPSGRLEIRCFGALEVRRDGRLLEEWPRRKAKLVLAGLLLYPAGLSMARMTDLLGEEHTPAILKVAILSLRRVLEDGLERGGASRYVSMLGSRYLVDRTQIARCDLFAFDQLVARGDGLRETAPREAAGAYAEAIALYRGALLDEPMFLPFFTAEREGYTRRALAVLAWLAGQAEPVAAEAYLKRAVELAPTDEQACIRLMRFFKGQGRLMMARKAYWDCRKALKAQLGLEPGEELELEARGVGG